MSLSLCFCSSLIDELFEKSVKIENSLNEGFDERKACFVISQLADMDQKARSDLSKLSDCSVKKIKDISFTHTQSLKKILNVFSISRLKNFSTECYFSAWLIIQHSDDISFQKQNISQFENNTEQYALLFDRIQINSGLMQRYGTQFDYKEDTGEILMKPIESMEDVDIHRSQCGLKPLCEYLKKSKLLYDKVYGKN